MAGLLDQGFADLGSGQVAARPVIAAVTPATTVVATTQAQTAAASRTAPAASAPQVNSAPVMASTAPQGDAVGTAARPGVIGNALRHLSPVGKAEAAPIAREAAGEDWSIQLGAFRGEAAAEQAVRHVASVSSIRGKRHEILAPAKGDSNRLYRACCISVQKVRKRCAELHRRGSPAW
jgi:hypothetical protein